MAALFESVEDYYAAGVVPDNRVRQLNGVLLTEMDEPSNAIRIACTRMNAVLWSKSGSDYHCFGVAGRELTGRTAPGAVALEPANAEVYCAWETRGYNLRTLALEFDVSLFQTFAPEVCSDRFMEGHILPSGYKTRPTLASIVGLLEQELDPGRAMGTLFTDTVTRLLALEIAATGWSLPARLPMLGERREPRLARALEFIEAHFLEDISLMDIAAASGLSLSLLTMRFQRDIGQTAYSYVIERRVQHAVHLLRSTDMPIAQVAQEAGFSDQQHLSRVIRARRSSTPKAIRMDSKG